MFDLADRDNERMLASSHPEISLTPLCLAPSRSLKPGVITNGKSQGGQIEYNDESGQKLNSYPGSFPALKHTGVEVISDSLNLPANFADTVRYRGKKRP